MRNLFQKIIKELKLPFLNISLFDIYASRTDRLVVGIKDDYIFSFWVLKNQTWFRVTEIQQAGKISHFLDGFEVKFNIIKTFKLKWTYEANDLKIIANSDLNTTVKNVKLVIL